MMTQTYKPKITQLDNTTWKVESQTHPNAYYLSGPHSCTCLAFKFHPEKDCKHMRALKAHLVDMEIRAKVKESTQGMIKKGYLHDE